MGLAPAHSSMAICTISSLPKDEIHQAIPDRSIICPISSSSGTSTASCSRDRPTYLLVMDLAPGMHLYGGVDVGLLVFPFAALCCFPALLYHCADDPVELRTERKAEVVGEEDRHLLQLVLGDITVGQRGVGLD